MGVFLRGLLKWTLAIVLLGGVVAYAVPAALEAAQSSIRFGDEEVAPEDATPSPSPSASPGAGGAPVEDGQGTPFADVVLIEDEAVDFAEEELVIGPGAEDGIALSFPLISGAPACVASATLEIQVEEATPTQLFVFPSALFELRALEPGPLSEDPILDAAPQAVAETDGNPGRLSWDVTSMYRTWATGEPFPTGGAAPEATPFTVVVRPEGAEVGREVVLLSAESGDAAPLLVWTGEEGCGSEAAAEEAATEASG